MANRSTRFILKNNPNSAAPFSGATLLAGEPIVNTAAGIMMFSGVTTGTNDWVQAGPGGNANFFEVGSNLYNLKIRNKITSYGGQSLIGQFLSGTTDGFVLAPISGITGVDTYVTNFSYNDSNVLSLTQNQSGQNFNVLINQMSGLTVSGTLSATTLNGNSGTITTNATNPTDIVNYQTLTGYSSTSDTYVTGGTITQQPSNTSISGTVQLSYNKTVGGTYTLPYTDVFVTGFTYDSASNAFTLKDNSGNTFTKEFTAVSGLTVNNLVSGQVVYAGTNKELKGQNGFTYNDGTKVLSVPSDGSVSVGTGGLSVAGDAVIQGSLTVFGAAVSAFTSQLYVEDDNITLNYNPTGQTIDTSLGAGWTIQDGSGIATTATTLQIGQLYGNTNILSNSEYLLVNEPSNKNRAFFTQVNDIIIRNTNYNKNNPNGVRVLAEGDILDGGTY